MARPRRWPLWVFFGGIVLIIVLSAIVRAGAHMGDAPVAVRGSVWRMRTLTSNFYGARVGDSVVLFDSGADARARKLDELLAQLGRTRDDVSDVFLTHGHLDHTAGAAVLHKARIHGGIGDSDMMSGRAAMQPSAARIMCRIMGSTRVMLTDAFLDSTDVKVGDATVRAVVFPGHTPGTMLYLYDGVLFVGDTMNYDGKKLDFMTPAIFNVDTAELHRHMATLDKVVDLSQVKVVCTGHGGCTPEADTQKLLADFLQRAKS